MSSNPFALFLSRSTSSPYAIVLSLGFGLVSYSFWGSLAAQSIGAIAIPVNPHERRKLGLDTSKSVEPTISCNRIYCCSQRQVRFGISGAASSLAVMAAALQIPKPIYSTEIKNYLLFLSVLLLSNGIYTFSFMKSTNNRLVAIHNKITSGRTASSTSIPSAPLTKTQADEAERLLRKWKVLHYPRIVISGLGWLGTFAVYMTTV
ncbi:hypothetical protein BJ912DRAFT_480831 [Pholiota molesta]|nr:hypothetical protein BJ912DRAFT_480831 [Pholiota molesta]